MTKPARAVGFHDTSAFLIGHTSGKLKDFTGRIIYLEFAGFRRMKYPVALIDTQDLQTAIKKLVPTVAAGSNGTRSRLRVTSSTAARSRG